MSFLLLSRASGADGTLSRLGFSYYLVKKITWRACKDLMRRVA